MQYNNLKSLMEFEIMCDVGIRNIEDIMELIRTHSNGFWIIQF